MSQQPTPLTDLPIPELIDKQINSYSFESIHVQEVTTFDPLESVDRLHLLDGCQVVAGDFGGDKGVIRSFRLTEGKLLSDGNFEEYVQGNGGEGYIDCLKKASEFSFSRNIPIGISWGTPLNGTKPLHHPKAKVFLEELDSEYGGDFTNLLPNLKACMNDGPAGLIAGTIAVNGIEEFENILFPINGGGLGMAVLKLGTVYATEAGHVEGSSLLNSYGQKKPCGVFGNKYVCIEQLGANKAGIEVQWEAKTGVYMRARDIEDRYKEGDELAEELYDHSALVVAHLIAGTAKAMGIDLTASNTAVVCHGGAFNFPSYGERVEQILDTANLHPKIFMTKDLVEKGSNACLEGAAYAALLG